MDMLFPAKNNNKKAAQNRSQAADIKAAVKNALKQTIKESKPAIKNGLLATGRALGTYAGSQVGMPILGQTVGEKVFAHISKAIGSGDYEIMGAVGNSLINPKTKSKGDGFRFVHREYIKDITSPGTGAFSVEGFDCNPGISANFPYLYAIAQQFEEFRINGMIFEFISTSSNYASTTALGTMIASAEYNSAATAYTTKVQMENANNAVQARLDSNLMFGLECNEFPNDRYYVLTPASLSTPVNLTTPATFYLGNVLPSVVTVGTVIGELWVSYDITFFRPRPSITYLSPGIKYAHMRFKYPVTAGLTDYAISYNNLYNNPGTTSNVVTGLSGSWQPTGFVIPSALKDDVYLLYYGATPNKDTLTTVNIKMNTSMTGSVNVGGFAIMTGSSGIANAYQILTSSLTSGSNPHSFCGAFKVSASGQAIISPSMLTVTTSTGSVGNDNVFGDLFILYLGNGTVSASF